jgi:hypothetical protein
MRSWQYVPFHQRIFLKTQTWSAPLVAAATQGVDDLGHARMPWATTQHGHTANTLRQEWPSLQHTMKTKKTLQSGPALVCFAWTEGAF